MKTTLSLLCLTSALLSNQSQSAVILSQNFNSSAVVADYVSATPSSGQFNAIGSSGAGVTVSITGGALTYARTASNSASFSRTTDFSPAASAIIYTLDLTVSDNSAAATSAAVFQVGSGFGTANAAESNPNTYARVGINFTTTPGSFSIRDITNGTSSANFAGTQALTWVLNNSGSSVGYTAPDATSPSLANDRADLWVGTTKVWNAVPVETATQSITDLKFAFTGGSGTITMDNLVVNAIPEPSVKWLTLLVAMRLLWHRRVS